MNRNQNRRALSLMENCSSKENKTIKVRVSVAVAFFNCNGGPISLRFHEILGQPGLY